MNLLARLAAKRIVSLILIAAIVTVDGTIPWHGMSFVPRALVDEPCAVATDLVILGAITRFRGGPPEPVFVASMLAWAVLIDIDHLPLEFGSTVLTEGTPRPYFHALWVPVFLIVATLVGRFWSRRVKVPASAAVVSVLAGMACGHRPHVVVVAGCGHPSTSTVLVVPPRASHHRGHTAGTLTHSRP
jgi:hypothetical protein